MIPTLYDYQRQAWVTDGRYVRCGHPNPSCGCYGTAHEGETAPVHTEPGPGLDCIDLFEGPHVAGDCPLLEKS